MEVALDFAVQCSPDHPWLTAASGMVQAPAGRLDPIRRESAEEIRGHRQSGFLLRRPRALWTALRDVVLFWVEQGVRIFRVDNPHTKPFPFWEWLIREVQTVDPDVIFLSEAFTRPKVMKALAKLGFTQSYTYFTWRTGKEELQAYLSEITALSRARIFPAEFLRQHAGHPAGPSAERRAVDVQGAGRAGRDAVGELRHLQRLRAARARADPRQGGISRFREIRAQDRAIGTSRATSRTISAGSTGCGTSNPALLQTSNLRFAQVDDAEVIGFVKELVARRQCGRGRHRVDNGTARASSGSISAISTIGAARRSRPRRARSRIWSPANATPSNGAACGCASTRAGPGAAVSLPSVMGARRERRCRKSTPSRRLETTSFGSRTPSSISCTSRRSPTATTTASAISPA